MKYLLVSLIVALLTPLTTQAYEAGRFDTLTTDGAWCWFADPRAIYHKGEKVQTYFSWITTKGDIMIAAYNHKTRAFTQQCLYKGLQSDDHANPVIFIRKDGRLIVFYSKHFDKVMHRVISTNPEDITSWGPESTFGNNVTYPYPFQVGNDILLFYRGDADWHPTMAVSHDDGVTFTSVQKFIVGGGQRPYTRFAQDKKGAIHIAFTTGHPRNEPTNKIYYACYKNGAFHKADGSLIKRYTGSGTALNIDTDQADVVYGAENGKGWIWDIAVGKDGKPVLVYAAFPTETQHDYYYARWTGKRWVNRFIEHSGSWFPQTPAGRNEPEPNYSGGLYLDPSNPKVVYLSKQVKGVFEIFRYTTRDKGSTWQQTAITANTPVGLVNVRPIVPRHRKAGYFDVIWMRGTYQFYANHRYHTALVYAGDAEIQQPSKTADVNNAEPLSAYLMTYFKDDTHGLYFALSEDGYTFTDVNNGQPVIAGDTIAEQKGIRDPHILRGPDGCFYLAMTDLHIYGKQKGYRTTEWDRPGELYDWGNNRGFVVMKSKDLIHWSHTVLDLHKAYPEYDLGCAWAPELIYDPDKGLIMIYFTMRKSKGRTKLYYAYMNQAFTALETAPELLFEYPDSTKQILDADITRLPDGRYVMMYVAQENPGGIKMAFSDHINRGYVYKEGQVDFERRSCEAPNVWKRLNEDKWVLMYDIFSVNPHNFGFAETSDFINFTNLGHFDQGVMRRTNFTVQKHGAVIHLTKSEAERLKAWYAHR